MLRRLNSTSWTPTVGIVPNLSTTLLLAAATLARRHRIEVFPARSSTPVGHRFYSLAHGYCMTLRIFLDHHSRFFKWQGTTCHHQTAASFLIPALSSPITNSERFSRKKEGPIVFGCVRSAHGSSSSHSGITVSLWERSKQRSPRKCGQTA